MAVQVYNNLLQNLVGNVMLDEDILTHYIEIMERKKYLEKHTNKIWEGENGYYYTYLHNAHDDRKLVKKKTKHELEDAIIQFYKDIEDNPTICDLFYGWLAEKLENGEIGNGTYDRYQSDWNRYIAGTPFTKTKISAVTEETLDQVIRQFIVNHKPTTKRFSNVRSIFIGMFKYAKRKHYSEISISTFFKDFDISKKLFQETPIDREKCIYMEDETSVLVEYLKAHPTTPNLCIVLMFQSGVRSAELAAIKYSDFKDGVLHIQRQEITYKKDPNKPGKVHEVVEYTKTLTGDRYIYLPDSSQDIVRQLREQNPNAEYLYAGTNGERLNKNTIGKYLKKACKACNIPYKSPHKIRRVYATTLINSNIPDSLIMSQLGHTTTETTRRYYYFANKDNAYKKEQINKCIQF